MKQMFKDLKLPLLLLVLMSLCATLAIPITPIDETRYVSVAWEMWNGHSFLVPHLNGAPYSHKPPLLFWLMHAGWALFGVNDFTPRLIPGIFSILCLFLTYRISLRIWPEDRKTAATAALILAGTALWDAWSVAIMFDMVLTFWILLGLLGTLRAAEKQRGGWLMLIAGMAGGLLTKGPAVFVYLLSIPLFRFWWDARKENPARVKWVLAILGAAALGFAIALCWAIPAAFAGGEEYRHAILWGQTVDRMTSSFAHRRPFWWYLPIVPLFFFPWILFRPSYAKLTLKPTDTGTRFCTAWLALPLLIFSLISGKQIHYLIPFIPAGALLIGRNIARADELAGKTSVKILGGLFLLFGAAAWIAPYVNLGGDVGVMEHGDTLFASIGLLISGTLLLFLPFRTVGDSVRRIVLCLTLVLVCSLVEARKNFLDDYELKETSAFIKTKMDAGYSVAHTGKYHGQYQFLGRLNQPITVLNGRENDIFSFSSDHPTALFISYQRKGENKLPPDALVRFTHEYRGKYVLLWEFPGHRP
jgi:4-amino-4-deoxy-L-arabinose transferase-like glycosyltransferase